MSSGRQIIFFDGVCNLCNGFVDFLVTRDRDSRFQFASLQGETARRLLPEGSRELRSVVLLKDGEIFEKSDAVLRVLVQLGGLYGWSGLFRVLPAFFRDWIYDLVAANRYRIFGRRESCRLPDPGEKEKFLD